MDKLLSYPGKTDKGVFTFLIDEEKGYLEKTASQYHPTIAAYINSAKKIPGKTQLLITALGAGEWFGANVNGDFFGEDQLAHEGDDYGFKTFQTNAKLYKHHVNRPNSQHYGEVLLSIYNPTYHRVELIIAVDHALAPDIIENIDNGEWPQFSMGCLRADSEVLLADFKTKKISEVEPGDSLVNAGGTTSVVDYPHSHHHKGTWYFVESVGMSDVEPTTEEHPWLVIPKEQTVCLGNPNNKMRKGGTCTTRRFQKKTCSECPHVGRQVRPEWRRADELTVGDYVGTPILKGISDKPEDRYAYLAGIYLAQGHVTTVGNRIVLNVNADDYRVKDKLEKLYPEYNWCWSVRDSTPNSANIESTIGYNLCNQLLTDCGKYAHHKHLSRQLMTWPLESQKIFLGGYIDGDGGVYKGSAYISTCNKTLANQVFHILLRCDCIADVNRIVHKPSTIVKKSTIEYQIWVGANATKNLEGYSFKTRSLPEVKMIQGRKFIESGYLWSPIISIETEECDEVVYNVAMKSGDYDLDSYVVNNTALHNCKIPFDICSICGNKAPNRRFYCEHLKYQLGQIDPRTGRQVHAINIRPRFFDISIVLIPADKIALTLKKVAFSYNPGLLLDAQGKPIRSSAEAAEKAASIEKEIPAGPPASEDVLDIDKAHSILRAGMELRSREKPIPTHVLDQIAGMGSLSDVMSTLSSLMIMPKPQEFQRIYLVCCGHKDLADKLDGMGACFDPEAFTEPTPRHEEILGLSPHRVTIRIVKAVEPFMEERSNFGPLLLRRLNDAVKTAQEYYYPQPTYYVPHVQPHEEGASNPIAILGLGAALYAAMAKGAVPAALKSLSALAVRHPLLTTAVGIGILSKLTEEEDERETYKGRYTPNLEMYPDASHVWDTVTRMREKPYVKVGAELPAGRYAAAARRLLIGVPALQVTSSYLQKRKEMSPDVDEGRLSRFVRKHPHLLSAALAADAVLATQGKGTIAATRHVGDAYRSWLKGEPLHKAANVVMDVGPYPDVKAASVQDTVVSSLVWPAVMGTANLPGRIVGGLIDQAAISLGSKLVEKNNQKAMTPSMPS